MKAEFESWTSYQVFAKEILASRRYLRSPRSESFLAAVKETTETRVFSVDQSEVFWRAIDVVSTIPVEGSLPQYAPCDLSRIMPLADKAHEGRVNPKGIPCLYVATEPWTAIGEVRPTLGARVTMASLVPTRKLQLVNCGSERAAPRFSEEPEAMFREMAVWAYISTAFSEPVTRADDQADYAPTQVLAELFKDMSLDGIAYQSAFGTDGYNVALFNVADAAITGCWVYRVANIKHDVQIEVGAKTWVSDEFTFPKVADFPPVEPSELR